MALISGGDRPALRSFRANRKKASLPWPLGASMPCRRFQDRRAWATSGRSCSAARRLFFKADFMALEEFPYGSATACNPMLVHGTDHFIQRQVRLFLNQREHP